jgi:hypothetical protein
MYALALKFNSVWLLLIGRFLCGYVHSWMLPLIGKCWNSCVKTCEYVRRYMKLQRENLERERGPCEVGKST